MEIIAKIQTDFPTKFGIPRQSGLVESLKGVITFEPKYRNPQGVYGLDGYSYIWLDIVDWCLIHQIDACHIEHRSILFIKDNTL